MTQNESDNNTFAMLTPVDLAHDNTDFEPMVTVRCRGCEQRHQAITFYAIDIPDITTDAIHAQHSINLAEVDEKIHRILGVDHISSINIPRSIDRNLENAYRWALLVDELPDHQTPAFYRWVNDGNASINKHGMPDDTHEFNQKYIGVYDSIRDFFMEFVLGYMNEYNELTELAQRYFNVEKFIEDHKSEYFFAPQADKNNPQAVYVLRA